MGRGRERRGEGGGRERREGEGVVKRRQAWKEGNMVTSVISAEGARRSC